MSGTPQEAWAAQALMRVLGGSHDPMDANMIADGYGADELMWGLSTYDRRQDEERKRRAEEALAWANLQEQSAKRLQGGYQFDEELGFRREMEPMKMRNELDRAEITSNAQGKQRMAELAASARLEQQRMRSMGDLEVEKERRARQKFDPEKMRVLVDLGRRLYPKDDEAAIRWAWDASAKGQTGGIPDMPQRKQKSSQGLLQTPMVGALYEASKWTNPAMLPVSMAKLYSLLSPSDGLEEQELEPMWEDLSPLQRSQQNFKRNLGW